MVADVQQGLKRWAWRLNSIVLGSLMGALVILAWPGLPDEVRGPIPDAMDYAYAAQSLTTGSYSVAWDGTTRTPYYTPGLPILLMPAVAVAGPPAAVWGSYASLILLAGMVALLAGRLGGPLAGPLTVLLVAYSAGEFFAASMVMSDLPSAALLALEAALIVYGRTPKTIASAGIVGAFLAWIRPPSAVWMLAGLVALMARSANRRKLAIAYVAGAAPLVLLLMVWQWIMVGSPISTALQTMGASPDRTGSLGSLFSIGYVFGPPWAADGIGAGGSIQSLKLPNLTAYLLELAGFDDFVLKPGVGIIGAAALFVLWKVDEDSKVFARFAVAIAILTLAVYAPYSYQSARYLFGPAALLGVAAAVGVMRTINQIARYAATRESQRVLIGTGRHLAIRSSPR